MKTTVKAKRPGRAPARKAPRRVSVKGDIARAMFARWEHEHHDARPLSWPEFQAKLEANRLREAPLFTK